MFHVCAKFMSFWKIDIYELPIPLETQTRVIEFLFLPATQYVTQSPNQSFGPASKGTLLPEIKEE